MWYFLTFHPSPPCQRILSFACSILAHSRKTLNHELSKVFLEHARNAVGDPGEGPGGPGPPLFFDQNEARRAVKKFLGDRHPPPPPPYLRVSMTAPLIWSSGSATGMLLGYIVDSVMTIGLSINRCSHSKKNKNSLTFRPSPPPPLKKNRRFFLRGGRGLYTG